MAHRSNGGNAVIRCREAARIWRRFCKHRFAAVGLVFILLLLGTALAAPLLAPHDPYQIGGSFSAAPGGGHLLGTDPVGRDVFSRLIYGARVSMSVGLGAAALTAVLGVLLGLEAGYFGGAADALIMRTADVFMSFPSMMLIIIAGSIAGPGLGRMTLIMGLLGWPSVARLVRGAVLSIKGQDYIKSAVALGFSAQRILFLHILPNALGPILVNTTFGVARSILMESSLSFLGLGVNPPTASWGTMLSDAQSLSTLTARPWLWVPAGALIFLSALAFNFAGDGLRDALDPRAHLG
jgi:peptide/nickel transport system permease protein